MANIGGRLCVGLREVGWSMEEREWGNECVNVGEEMGRVGGRCIAMRMEFERKNGNGLCG